MFVIFFCQSEPNNNETEKQGTEMKGGVMVSKVTRGSPADKTDLRIHDIITQVRLLSGKKRKETDDTIPCEEIDDIFPCDEIDDIIHCNEIDDIIYCDEFAVIKYCDEIDDIMYCDEIEEIISCDEIDDIMYCDEIDDIIPCDCIIYFDEVDDIIFWKPAFGLQLVFLVRKITKPLI